MERRLASFEEFWPYYVAQHTHPANRALHFLGTSLAVATVAAALTLAALIGASHGVGVSFALGQDASTLYGYRFEGGEDRHEDPTSPHWQK